MFHWTYKYLKCYTKFFSVFQLNFTFTSPLKYKVAALENYEPFQKKMRSFCKPETPKNYNEKASMKCFLFVDPVRL